MVVTRKNVWNLGSDWADDILWYARGVRAMKTQPLATPTSWRFYAAVHGFNAQRWTAVGGYDPATDPLPSQPLVNQFWQQCQHGSWYFLPWHRGYVLAIEANLRAAIVAAGGPSDWAMPYWNYFGPNEAALPPAFGSPDWPDGKGDNPLYMSARFGPKGNGKVYIPLNQVNLKAMSDPDFTGSGGGGGPGFGGIATGFSHSGQTHGGIESQPHDVVHGLVGGQRPSPRLVGAMADPRTAALDPIFWLHHANIDRLWEVWNENPPTHVDPSSPAWRAGPASSGQRAFCMPMPDGSTWTYTPADTVSITALGYTYDDLSPAVGSPVPVRSGAGAPQGVAGDAEGAPDVTTPRNVEIVGANDVTIEVKAAPSRTQVRLDRTARRKVSDSLVEALDVDAAAPDRVFLNLENVRGNADASGFSVYVGLPDGADPAEHPELLAGSVGLFGISQASDPDEEHAGEGITYVLEISDVVDALHVGNAFDVEALPVTIVPDMGVDAASDVTIGRVSIFRQGR